jgi:hypothetical protein
MTDPRQILTEENPESKQDFQQRQLTEVGGVVRSAPTPQVLTEDLPEEEEVGPQNLNG